MGYNNETASLNKYSGMKEYCDKKITTELSEVLVFANKKEEEIKALKPKFEFQAKQIDNLIPVAAIDGGIATLFANEISETKLLKVAAGFSTEWAKYFKHTYENYIHVYSGQLKWPDGVNKDINDLATDMIKILLDNDTIRKALTILKITDDKFTEAMHSRVNHLKGGRKNLVGFEDNVREIFELSTMVNFTHDQMENKEIEKLFLNEGLELPYLLIKDGTLYPSKMTASSLFADAVAGWFNRGDVFVVGVVKASRFVNQENVWSKVIKKYASEVKSHTFFRLPDKIELTIDPYSKEQDYRRFFLSIFGGESVFEIQLPRILSNDPVKTKAILQVIASQITFRYGGSISTNSFAHENASLPESEARYLTEALRSNVNEIINKKSEKKND